MKEDQVEVSTPGGWKAKATGPQVMLSIILLLCTAVLCYMIIHHESAANDRYETLHNDNIEINSGLNEMIYILALSQEDRAKLNITMPTSLRDKLKQ